MAGDSSKMDKKSTKAIGEDILNGFQALRAEQRSLANKLTEFEMDLNEHKLVIETLKNVDENRKCFRLIGGILCERTVSEVLPQLQTNKEQLTKVIEAVTDQLTKKGVELNEYKEKHNIRFKRQEETQESEEATTSNNAASSSRGNVLVTN